MKCKQRHGNGKCCKYDAEKGSQFCYVHNPKLMPLYFIADADEYAAGSIEVNLPIEKAKSYIDKGVAMQVSYWLRVKIEKKMLVELKMALKIMLMNVKKAIAADDKNFLTNFFGGKLENKDRKISDFIKKEKLSDKEKTYLRRFIKEMKM